MIRPAPAAMAELIAKLEAAERGSRDLTADIYDALGFEVIRRPRHPAGIAWRFRDPRRYGARWERMQDLSESLDAALKLVPDIQFMAWWRVNKVAPEGGKDMPYEAAIGATYDARSKIVGHAHTAPLALDIAALRARSAP